MNPNYTEGQVWVPFMLTLFFKKRINQREKSTFFIFINKLDYGVRGKSPALPDLVPPKVEILF